jgi:dihydrofolate synthase / folylpolyglutamate synthase
VIFDSPGGAKAGSSARYRELIDRLYALAKTGMTLGLEPMARVLAKLGHPERAYPAIHIAGSNGKGSTSAFAASILSAHGLDVGLYTSPHLTSLTERIQIVRNGRFHEIPEDEFVEAMLAVEKVAPDFEGLSFFEAITAAGLVVFQGRGVDVAVIEAGLGARLDATRLVDAHVSVLTDSRKRRR